MVAGNSGSSGNPVFAMTTSSWPAARSASQAAEVRRHCQVTTGPSGSPVWRFQARIDSRWFEIPMAAISIPGAVSRQAAMAATVLDQIWPASCSTHPDLG